MQKISYSKAVKLLKPLKALTYGATFSGKTLSSLLMANGYIQAKCKCDEATAWKKILLIDTEEGRGSLYSSLGEYNYYKFEPPYVTEKLDAIIQQINGDPNIEVIIIDSLTHFWTKDGGLLEQKSILDNLGGNSYVNWDKVGIKLNKTISTILASPKDMFLTLRAKMDTVLTPDDSGKIVPKTFGIKPDFRDGFVFECDIVFNVDKEDHSLLVEKGIPGMEKRYDKATIEFGKLLYEQMSNNASSPIRTIDDVRKSIKAIAKKKQEYINLVQIEVNGKKLEEIDNMEYLLKVESKLLTAYRKDQKK